MSRYDTGTDDRRVRVRASKHNRPRTKRRPDYSNRPLGRVISVDRGRFGVATSDTVVTAVKARELPRSAVVIGDLVRLTGDLSGVQDTLARIVAVEPRKNVLRRSLEEAPDSRGEKVIVANADLMVIVAAAADPEPRVGMVDRCLVAAQEAGIPALLCMTKTDLASPAPFVAQFAGFPLQIVETSIADKGRGLAQLQEILKGKFSVLLGHSGVGKSTLINELEPRAGRAVGKVSELTGKGRHTSTSAIAVPLESGGWLVDTPGVRSFGLAHVNDQDVLDIYPGVQEAAEHCMPNCSHFSTEDSCYLDQWARDDCAASSEGPTEASVAGVGRQDLVRRARSLLEALPRMHWETPTSQ